MNSVSAAEHPRVHRIVLSLAITGEAVGIEHYARMIPLARGTDQQLALLEDAWRERGHLELLRQIALDLGYGTEDGRDDPYWSRITAAFAAEAAAGDLLGCHVVQDLVLESFALTLYGAAAPHLDDAVGRAFRAIAEDEKRHLQNGIALLRQAWAADAEGTFRRIERAHQSVTTVLAAWIRPQDCAPVCGVCAKVGGGCAKPDLERVQLDVVRMRAGFISCYGGALREVGVAPGIVTRWLARLLG